MIRLAEAKEFQGFEARGGAIEGASPRTQVKVVSSWPSRGEQLSILAGQILGPGATLAAQFIGVGGTLAGQIKQKIEDLEKERGEPHPRSALAEIASCSPSSRLRTKFAFAICNINRIHLLPHALLTRSVTAQFD